MVQRKRKQKYILYIISAVFVLAVLAGGQHLNQKREEVSQMAGFFAPVMKVMRHPILWYHHLRDEMGAYLFAVESNKNLRKENAVLKGWQHEALFLRKENKDLKVLLEMAEAYTTNPVAARVLADTRSPYARTILIDAGKAKGVAKGQAVLAEGGLAGRVLAVAGNSARVLLLGDYNARVPVKLLESGTLAIAKGGRYQALDLILTEGATAPQVGEMVVTSGIGGVFASGIPVGLVSQVDAGHIKVSPYVNFTKLDKVLVHRRPVFGVISTTDQGLE